MRVRRLQTGESALFKLLRLRALADAPYAFAHSYEEISAKPDSYWDEMTRSVTEPGRHVMVLAEEGSTAIGMAFGILPSDRPGIPHLGGMWVDPEARRRAVGRALADAVIEWARERGFTRIALWATEGNRPAIALYKQMGFSPTGRTDRLTSNPALAASRLSARCDHVARRCDEMLCDGRMAWRPQSPSNAPRNSVATGLCPTPEIALFRSHDARHDLRRAAGPGRARRRSAVQLFVGPPHRPAGEQS